MVSFVGSDVSIQPANFSEVDKKIVMVNIIPKAIEDIPHNDKGFEIKKAVLNGDNLELDIGYIYYGGRNACVKAYSDMKVSETAIPMVSIFFDRDIPGDMKVKGGYSEEKLIISLNHPCFQSPVSISMHHYTGSWDQKANSPKTSVQTILR